MRPPEVQRIAQIAGQADTEMPMPLVRKVACERSVADRKSNDERARAEMRTAVAEAPESRIAE